MGLRQFAGVGDQFAAAAAQLHLAAPDPFGATGLRVASPVHDRADANRSSSGPWLEGAGRSGGELTPEDSGRPGLRVVDSPIRGLTCRLPGVEVSGLTNWVRV